MPNTLTRIAAILMNSPWAIQESWLQEMYAIFIAHHNGDELKNIIANANIPQSMIAAGAEADPKHRGMYRKNRLAIIPIQGPIFPKANLMTEFCGATSLETVSAAAIAADNDPDISKIVYPTNSPGGVVTGIDEFGAVLRNMKKPTFGHVSGVGASAAYWILSQMGSISISPISSVGSIGVIMSATKYRKAGADEYPKQLEFISSLSPKKRLDPESEEGKTEIYAMVNKIAEVFANDVAAGRKVSLETVLESFGQGGMITGDAAVVSGMVDQVNTFEALLARLEDEEQESTSYSSYGDAQMKRNEYREKHPDEFAAIQAEATAGITATLTQVQAQITSLSEENAKLKASNDAHEAQLKAVEKEKAIRIEKENQVKAEAIFNEAFKASKIPQRLEAKVRLTCAAPEAHTKDGVLDAESFKAAITAEVGDWVKELGITADGQDTTLKGIGSGGAEGDSTNDDAKADAVADTLLGFIQTQTKE